MAIDPAMVDAMLGTFRDLLAEARGKGLSGPDVDEMATALADMEALGSQLSDLNEFSTRLANGGYYPRFTDAYTRVMLAAAGGMASASAGGMPAPIPEDADLLAQSLQAYEGSLAQLRAIAGQEPAIAALERILAIGRSSVTYPVFLRQVDEEGLYDVLAGTVTPTREQLVAELDQLRSLVDPAREAHAAALLAARDALAAASATGSIDPFTYELARFELAWEHAPAVAQRDAIVQRLPRLLDLVIDWLDAHTSWAARDDRYAGASAADTQRRIEMARECNPGFYEVRAAHFAEYFGPAPWWERPELGQERSARRILWSDDRMALALEAIPRCVPETAAPPDLVARAEAFGPNRF
jgi:hypothetical protein